MNHEHHDEDGAVISVVNTRTMNNIYIKSICFGTFAGAALLALYGVVVGVISGLSFAVAQFSTYWYFIVALAVGFGVQAGLYVYLRALVEKGMGAGRVLGVTGTTSTAAMISCCAHYLANILPVLGVTGAVAFIAQYQSELFWVGIALNLAGIVYIATKVIKFKRHL